MHSLTNIVQSKFSINQSSQAQTSESSFITSSILAFGISTKSAAGQRHAVLAKLAASRTLFSASFPNQY